MPPEPCRTRDAAPAPAALGFVGHDVDALVDRIDQLLPGAPGPLAATWVWTMRAGRVAEAFTRELLAGEGIDNSEFTILLVLWFAGSPYRSSPADLAREVVLTQSGTARALQRAVRNGTVRKVGHPADGRAIVVELTAAGKRLVERTVTLLLARLEERLGPIDAATGRRLALAGRELAAVLEPVLPPPAPPADAASDPPTA
jgi:DNA-binding MarR family transcriptional regulator